MGDDGRTLQSPQPLFENPNPSSNSSSLSPEKKIVVIMGATGSGKSRLSIDLASHFAGVEVINADSMQVYQGLDVLTNKVPFLERDGVPHHLLGTVDASVEFTSRDFRDLAVPIIDDILSRDGLPVIVGGTNYYIQALVSPFLIDDAVQDMEEDTVVSEQELSNVDLAASYEIMFVIVPRIPGIFSVSGLIHRRFLQINRYLSLYASSGVLPSTLFQGKAAENWGRADNFRFNCCFIWLDVSLPVLDKYVDQRVDCMIDSGLLLEVYDIYKPNADYTRGLRQAIGAREFEEFFKECFLEIEASGFPCLEGNASSDNAETGIPILRKKADNSSGATLVEILCSRNYRLQYLLDEAIDKLKSNTRKLVRRQIRRLNRLKTYFGWDLHYVDATEAFLCNSGDMWHAKVVEPCIGIVNTFLSEKVSVLTLSTEIGDVRREGHVSRDLWSQYICEACGNRVLRGAHEWEQHKQGRGHRKRILSLRKKSLQ
ncbi:tRNA dimethylallyltransferase 2 [Asparagus officinalis]|uniref:tRNA dimethylallyltransferase 2 n=1 Tax=Asparagus officinalis TaxID=4686 RepID=UPI00098E57C9|nr:tRNA dimethylallyltransferase 2 [Asparagus officinalis]